MIHDHPPRRNQRSPNSEGAKAEDSHTLYPIHTNEPRTDQDFPTKHENAAKRQLQIAHEWVRFTAWRIGIKPTITSSGFWTAFATIIIAGATLVYVHYARKQWQAMSRQLTVMQRTLKLTRSQLESASGAVVYAWRPFSFVTPTDMAINLSNSGHTTARHIHGALDISFFSVPAGNPAGKRVQRTLNVASIGPFNASDPDSGNSRYQWRIPDAVSKQEARDMAAGKIGMKANLRLSYNDGFRVVKDDDCYVRLGFFIRTPYFSSSGGGDSECSDLSKTLPTFYSALKEARNQAARAAQRHNKN